MNKGLESFYKMRDTLIAEGYNYPQCFETMCEVEAALLALELIKKCFYVAKSSGAILRTDYGFEHEEELKEVLS